MLDFITCCDFYKVGHRAMLLPGTTRVLENWTGRAGRQAGVDAAVFFGLRAHLKYDLTDLANQTFFSRPRSDVIYDYQLMLDNSLEGAPEIGTDHIGALHDLQYLPLEYRALPEGTVVPHKVPCFTSENTHDDFAWLPGYLETLASSRIWLPSQSATTAREYRRILENYCKLTGGDPNFVDWQGHDFSFRGMGSPEAAMMSGGGHLLSFKGTDTIPAIKMLHDIYDGEGKIGGSVAASEHMVMCLDGKENERATYERLMRTFPTGPLSQVSDTWNLWNVITNILPSLKDVIMVRKGKLVIRPDSGDPVLILTGDASSSDPRARKGVIELLWDIFGGTTNAMGFKELDGHIGAIYGDSITKLRATQIFERLMAKGFASTNVVLGIGSYTYQYTTRDESGFAMKATWARVNGKEHFLSKDPITDSGLKKSARGRLAVYRSVEDGNLRLQDGLTYHEWLDFDNNFHGHKDLLTPVWRDGRFLRRDKLADIRARARQ